jgi:FKBP-type peptidyl-prolyl cis-trans isomerase SlyD
MQIADRCVVSFHYTLTNDAGEILDSSSGREPLAYLHGAGNIVPGLESAMTGRQAGDKFKVAVAPEEGYGVHHEGLVQQVPRDAFAGVDEVQVGMEFHAQGPQGPLAVTVTAVDGDTVTIDGNHPLAGKTLHFDIEVSSVRDASLEETLHGHVHGAGGVEH